MSPLESNSRVEPQYRQDPLSKRWVIIGGNRAARPNEFFEEAVRPTGLACPFCAGYEKQTPPALAEYRQPSLSSLAPDWDVRVVPNKFPAVVSDHPVPAPSVKPIPRKGTKSKGGSRGAGDAKGTILSPSNGPLRLSAPGFGQHEVIIESSRHVVSFTDLTPSEAELTLRAYRDRIRTLAADGRFRYVQIFKNVGPQAGASIEHSHSQLMALPTVPDVLAQELASCREHYQVSGQPLLSEIIEQELTAELRIVQRTENYVAFCPYASAFPFELWLAPRQTAARFEDLEDSELGELSRFLQDVIGRIESSLGRPSYNYFLHTQPFDTSRSDHYHWHIEIFPRLTKTAGFEWSTGCFINPTSPELAAEVLRASPRSAMEQSSSECSRFE